MTNTKNLKLTVTEAHQQDVGRSIARLSQDHMNELGVESGEILSIKGKKETVAIVWRALTDSPDSISIDGTTRFNASAGLGDQVDVRKAETKTAQKVVLAPNELVKFTADPTPYFKQRLLEKPMHKGMKLTLDILGTTLHYTITATSPKGFVLLNQNTKLELLEQPLKEDDLHLPEVSYEDIGGLREEIEQIREMIEIPMKHPEVFERLGIGAPKGVLLTGPPGTGKTLLAKAVASETESQFYSINGPEIMSKFYGESEKQLRDIFKNAEKNAPSIIFIDEIDSIAPKREDVSGEVERRIVAQLLTSLDGLKSRGQVVVIAATNRADALDPALRRPGRFDREIGINVPDTGGRNEILQIHTRGMPLGNDVKLQKLAEMTIGYTGADLEILCKEAAMKSLKNYIPSLKQIDEQVPTNVLEKIEVSMQHFKEAFQKVEPSAMREVLIRKPTVKWTDIGGLEKVKERLKEAIEWPLKDPESFKKVGIKPPKGILLYGPPGTGKTLLAKAVATEAEANFIAVKGPELISKWVGESEKQIRDIFKKARQVAPSIIFFDEFDSISKMRGLSMTDATERIVNQLLTEIDGVEELEKVTIIAATNRPDLIDPALLRPGRIDLKVDIPLPDPESRKKIFEVHTKNMPLEKVNLDHYAKESEGFSGADIEAICKKAGMNALRRSKKSPKMKITVTKQDIDMAFEQAKSAEKKEENLGKEYTG